MERSTRRRTTTLLELVCDLGEVSEDDQLVAQRVLSVLRQRRGRFVNGPEVTAASEAVLIRNPHANDPGRIRRIPNLGGRRC